MRERFATLLDLVPDAMHERRALEHRHPRPGVGRPVRGIDRALGILALAQRDLADRLAGRGESAVNVSPLALPSTRRR